MGNELREGKDGWLYTVRNIDILTKIVWDYEYKMSDLYVAILSSDLNWQKTQQEELGNISLPFVFIKDFAPDLDFLITSISLA